MRVCTQIVIPVALQQSEAAKVAREKLEIVEERIAVRPEEIGLIIGKQGRQIHDLEQISACKIKVSTIYAAV